MREAAEAVNKPSKMDPFVACRVYQRECLLLARVQADSGTQLTSLVSRFSSEDSNRVVALKAIMLEQMAAHKTMLETLMKIADAAIDSAKAIDTEKDAAEFSKALHGTPLPTKPPRLPAGDSPSSSPYHSPKLGSSFPVTSIFSLSDEPPSPATVPVPGIAALYL